MALALQNNFRAVGHIDNDGQRAPFAQRSGVPFGNVNTSTTDSRVETFDERLNGWKAFFGPPTKNLDVMAPHSKELDILPDAYTGRISMMTQLIMRVITEEERVGTSFLLPWLVWENSLEYEWDVWKFDNHVMDATPHLSVSRLVTSQSSREGRAMERQGLAMILEYDFYRTEKGRLAYVLHTKQIANACQETNELNAHVAILQSHYNEDRWNRPGDQMGTQRFTAMVREQMDFFAVLQKTENGIINLVAYMQKILKARGVHNANALIVPNGALACIEQRPENTQFLLSGKQNPMSLPGGFQKHDIMAGSGLRVIESRDFVVGDNEPNIDPYFKTVAVGQHNLMLSKWTRDIPAEEYRTRHRKIVVYDEDLDEDVDITLNDAVKHCMLFDTETGDLTTLGEKFARKFRIETLYDLARQAGMVTQVENALKRAGNPSAMNGRVGSSGRSRGRTGTGADNDDPVVISNASSDAKDDGLGVDPAAHGTNATTDALQAGNVDLDNLLDDDIADDSMQTAQADPSADPSADPRQGRQKSPTRARGGKKTVKRRQARAQSSNAVASPRRGRSPSPPRNRQASPARVVAAGANAGNGNRVIARRKQFVSEGYEFNGRTAQMCLEHDIPFPMSFILFRLGAMYEAAPAVLMVAGSATGNTLIGHADTSGENDAQRKVWYLHFTLYAKSIVRETRNIVRIDNVFIRSYMGGNNSRFFTEDDRDGYRNKGVTNGKSIHCVAVPGEWEPANNILDCCGYNDRNYDSAADPSDENKLYYPSAQLYREHWGWHHTTPNPENHFGEEMNMTTITAQSKQRHFRYEGGDRSVLDITILNKGAFGPRAYHEGFARLTRGVISCLPPSTLSTESVIAIRS